MLINFLIVVFYIWSRAWNWTKVEFSQLNCVVSKPIQSRFEYMLRLILLMEVIDCIELIKKAINAHFFLWLNEYLMLLLTASQMLGALWLSE